MVQSWQFFYFGWRNKILFASTLQQTLSIFIWFKHYFIVEAFQRTFLKVEGGVINWWGALSKRCLFIINYKGLAFILLVINQFYFHVKTFYLWFWWKVWICFDDKPKNPCRVVQFHWVRAKHCCGHLQWQLKTVKQNLFKNFNICSSICVNNQVIINFIFQRLRPPND